MTFLSWNSRGLGTKEKSLFKNKRVDKVLIQETKSAGIITKFAQSFEFLEVDADGSSGGLTLHLGSKSLHHGGYLLQ